MKLIFASNNAHKIAEIREKLPMGIEIFSLKDIQFFEEIPEPFDTFYDNAKIKAETIYRFSHTNVFSEDSGLVIPALDGGPGVFSARYAGEGKNDRDNLEKVLKEMEGKENREAYYLAHICLIWDGEEIHFEGRCEGRIADSPKGNGGFGYDPIFIPNGFEETFGELEPNVKLSISHRTRALQEMVQWLEKIIG